MCYLKKKKLQINVLYFCNQQLLQHNMQIKRNEIHAFKLPIVL